MLYQRIKPFRKPVKYGVKYGKSFAAAYSVAEHADLEDNTSFVGQALGLIVFPLLYFIIEPFSKRLPPLIQQKMPYIFYAGLSLGSALGSCISNSLLKALPNSFNVGICALLGITIVAIVGIVIPFLIRKIREKFFSYSSSAPEVTELKSDFRNRFLLGLEIGVAIGAALGATAEFIAPGVGIIGSGIGAIVGSILGCIIPILAPQLFKKSLTVNSLEDEASQYATATKSIRIGVLLGSSLGAIIGTFLFPGVGTLLCTALLGGIGGTLGGGITILNRKLFVHKTTTSAQIINKTNLGTMAFSMKASMTTLSCVGAVVGTFLFPGLGTVAGMAIGALMGCVIGSLASSIYCYYSQNTDPPLTANSPPNATDKQQLPQINQLKKAKLGYSIGCVIGGFLGAIIGSCAPGIGTLLGAAVGSFIGGTVGIMVPVVVNNIKNLIEPVEEIPVKEETAKTLPNVEEKITDSYGKIQSEITRETPESSLDIISVKPEPTMMSTAKTIPFRLPSRPCRQVIRDQQEMTTTRQLSG